jgi:hypothetical protein
VTVTDPASGATTTDTFTITQAPPPTISAINDQSANAGIVLGPIPFTIGGGFDVNNLLLQALTNTSQLPPSAFTFGGSGANRTVTIQTPPNTPLTASAAIRVTDPVTGQTATENFAIFTVVPQPPQISAIGDRAVVAGASTGVITFTVSDFETPAGSLVVTASSSNSALIPQNAIVLGGSGADRAITITTLPGTIGTAVITVTVTDADNQTATETFTLSVLDPNSVSRPFAVARGPGPASQVIVYNGDGTVRFDFSPFGGFDCGARAIMADFNGDGVDDIACSTRFHDDPSPDPTWVTVFDGTNLARLFDFAPFGTGFMKGANLSAGDMTGDGRAELAIAADYGGGARVRIFSPDGNGGFTQLADFFALQDANGNADTSFRGGARTAIGDFDGDGFGDLAFAAGFLGGPRVALFNGKLLGSTGGPKLRGDFFAMESALRNGLYIAAGDVNGDGRADLVVTPSTGGSPRVRIFSGTALLAADTSIAPFADFFVGDSNTRNGGRISVRSLDGDAFADLIVGDATDAGSAVKAFSGQSITNGIMKPMMAFDAFPGDTTGVFVG